MTTTDLYNKLFQYMNTWPHNHFTFALNLFTTSLSLSIYNIKHGLEEVELRNGKRLACTVELCYMRDVAIAKREISVYLTVTKTTIKLTTPIIWDIHSVYSHDATFL